MRRIPEDVGNGDAGPAVQQAHPPPGGGAATATQAPGWVLEFHQLRHRYFQVLDHTCFATWTFYLFIWLSIGKFFPILFRRYVTAVPMNLYGWCTFKCCVCFWIVHFTSPSWWRSSNGGKPLRFSSYVTRVHDDKRTYSDSSLFTGNYTQVSPPKKKISYCLMHRSCLYFSFFAYGVVPVHPPFIWSFVLSLSSLFVYTSLPLFLFSFSYL